MEPSPTQIVVALALLVVTAGIWFYEGRGRWRARLEDRFVLGVPWGTVLVVGSVVAFYLFAQSGLTHWSDPVVYAFVSWSYFYPLGLVTAGFSHGSPAHLIGNMTGTLALAPIAEYAWSHYPRSTYDSDGDPQSGGADAETDGGDDEPWDTDDELLPDQPTGSAARSFVERPLVRALVLFPGALFAIALLTSVYSLGPGLGFSGAVYGIIGFAVVYYPLRTVVGVVAASALGVVWNALANPIVRGTVSSGPPSPPSWAGIGFQAHALGFLLGAFAALALLTKRNRIPSTQRVFFGLVGIGLAMSLWLVVWPGGDDVFYLYRGAGVVALLVVTGLVTVAATSTRSSSWLTKRKGAIGALVLLTVLLALPTVLFGIVAVDDAGIEQSQAIEIQDYTVAYANNTTSGHVPGVDLGEGTEEIFANEVSGVVLISEDREIWTRVVRPDALAHSGNETVVVGGPGWRETVRAQRTGWNVAGNETAFVVDLHHDDETVRSFTSDPLTAGARIDGHAVTVVPTRDAFELRVSNADGTAETVAIPDGNGSTTLGGITITSETEDGVQHVYMETDDSRALVATEETYA
ncbi:hypothetical protein L593_14870 [Salinarchaeum sp. Harcht-Bsk1]|uniref:rhomboid family intramembrane serine protease n=1 Tax=Salinarchaeum sp. Harcht-Bsk1 TaxID=1333523 RepID=UPI0003422A3D|nr:rhomboid family intramembrane serine protease [Salinarchaeum sp. Harcht-Bsk1]AGN02908.1 hypothetical protein L593_14870 [Salinarchaeum sp. Harcht-Bsk1]